VTTALVTGANQGLGFALVGGVTRRLDAGADVYLTGRSPDRVRAAADRLAQAGRAVRTAVLDVRDADAVESLAAQLAERHGGIDIVISNAAARFETDRLSLDELDAVMIGYAEAVRSGQAAVEGWPDHINIPSKVSQVAAARIFARDQPAAAGDDRRLIAAVCPGLVDTAASRPWFDDMSSAQSPEQAAVDVVELALGPANPAHYGQLVQHGRVVPWK
jgi:NAD(P)-dependent dehydrogenase (short-subunit alcohol dehydrogenase family)